MWRSATAVLVAFFLLISSSSCERKEPKQPSADGGIKVLTTFLPIYIFTMNVADGVEGTQVDVLIPPELVGPHGYEPTPSDIGKVANADILIANGLNIETFLDRIKKAKPGIKVAFASDGIATLPDIPTDRVWEDEGEHSHNHEQGAPNPHVWVSPYLAAQEVLNIAEELSKVDPKNARKYSQNAQGYSARLVALGDEFKKTLTPAANKNIVTIHNAFDYLARDVGINVVAVLRVDPLAQPRARELAEMSKRISAEGAAGIFAEPQFSVKLANVLANETGVTVYELDPVAVGIPDPGLYEKIMRGNLKTLQTALKVPDNESDAK